ncbi:MAG: 4Fe-4S binding protein [Coriobacteriales bacterium]|jgi:ferredoxin-type protein NapH|nr:4Fe-4S binding protein [Coriobacteriales bacterium]
MKISYARRITLILVVLAVLLSFFVNVGTGTLSSMGWEVIAYLCPLGAVEAFLASWSFVPRALIALIFAALATILLGKVFCAWVCPVPPLRRFFTFKKNDSIEAALEASRKALEASSNTPRVVLSEPGEEPMKKATASEADIPVSERASTSEAGNPEMKGSAACSSGCTSCTTQRKKLDSRHIVLGGALLSTAVFGFPVFCIVCPVGLTFASLIAFWRLVGFNEPSWALLIFPVFLALELFVLRKWCIKFCPLGAVMSLLSIPNRLFKPHVDTKKCLRSQGIDCTVCVSVCEEEIDPHFPEGMHECTKCGLCKEKCPAHAITIPLYITQSKKKQKLSLPD